MGKRYTLEEVLALHEAVDEANKRRGFTISAGRQMFKDILILQESLMVELSVMEASLIRAREVVHEIARLREVLDGVDLS